jgi:hypothetical protein
MEYYAREWEQNQLDEVDFDAIENDMPRCQPIGCDNGIHLPGCPIAKAIADGTEVTGD